MRLLSRARTTTYVAALGLTLAALTAGVTIGSATPASAAGTIYPVPTSNADLGRIVTAPDGNMWFVERDADKVGRITPAGVISEFTLPQQTTQYGTVKDIDVSPDGTVWVVWDSGNYVLALNPSTGVIEQAYHFGGSDPDDFNPYVDTVRAAGNGTVWVTTGYSEPGVASISGGHATWSGNAPECDPVLGIARDNTAWCAKENKLIHVNAAGNGGATYALPDLPGPGAPWPYSLAAGPAGSIWFGAYDAATMFTAASDGVIGYLDQSTSQVQAWSTGSNSAPSSLVQGPDGNMWFTTVNEFHPGIGHISAAGVGVISSTGGYQPTSLTFAHDGSIWATDSADNSILHYSQADLQSNDAGIGSGATYTVPGHAQPGGTPGTVVKPSKTLTVKKNKVAVKVSCPAQALTGCAGTLTLLTRAKHPKVLGKHAYQLAAGKKAKVKVKLTKKGLKRLERGHVTKVRAQLRANSGATYTHQVKVRR